VLNQYKVDLVFSGHVHSYERSCQVYKYKCQAGAPWYITIGDGGNAEGLASTWVEPQPEWSSFRQASYGFGELRAVNSTSMEWRWHQNQDLLPVIADSFTFTKDQGERKYLRQEQEKGVTRQAVMTIAKEELGIETEERTIDRTELYICDEMFLCGTGAQISPVVSVDMRPVGGTGVIGPVTQQIMELYHRAVRGEYPRFADWVSPVYNARRPSLQVGSSR